jgi:hypothetical protein
MLETGIGRDCQYLWARLGPGTCDMRRPLHIVPPQLSLGGIGATHFARAVWPACSLRPHVPRRCRRPSISRRRGPPQRDRLGLRCRPLEPHTCVESSTWSLSRRVEGKSCPVGLLECLPGIATAACTAPRNLHVPQEGRADRNYPLGSTGQIGQICMFDTTDSKLLAALDKDTRAPIPCCPRRWELSEGQYRTALNAWPG